LDSGGIPVFFDEDMGGKQDVALGSLGDTQQKKACSAGLFLSVYSLLESFFS